MGRSDFDELEQRYIRGEISKSEMERRKAELREQRRDAKKSPKPEKSNRGYLWAGVAIVALPVLLVGGCVNWFNNLPESTNYEVTAQRVCRERVMDRLKAPSTAKFYDENAASRDPEDAKAKTYDVIGKVESQNSFGGMVQMRYRCTVRANGETATATLISLA